MDHSTVNSCFTQLHASCNLDVISEDVLKVLKDLTYLMRSPKTRAELTPDQWSTTAYLSQTLLKILAQDAYPDNFLDFLAEFLRFLRNSCAGLQHNQHYVLRNSYIFSFGKTLLKHFFTKDGPKDILVLKLTVQFFGNVLVGHDEAKILIWNIFFGEDIFRYIFQHQDMSVRECTLMVLFNCMTDDISKAVFETEDGHELLVSVIDTLFLNQIDWGLLFLEFLIKQENFWECCYQSLASKHRLLILDIIAERLKSTDDDPFFCIPVALIQSLKNLFLVNLMRLQNMNSTDIEPSEMVTMLGILCSASIMDAYVSVLQSSKDLIQYSVESLKCVHLLGKQGCDTFACMSDIKFNNSQFSEEISCHPYYGFKKNLIRLIGNLCYNCKENQNILRSLDGIPLILDCCKFDAKNPYITQWCILAIRNILENNAENQSVLAGITLSGDIVDAKFLKEMGLQVHCENEKIRINTASYSYLSEN